ncbi:MAG: helix-turn-helix domain-containing protein [Candidatus Bathyarchaeota archaeon]|nr:helix-turn-helix domain-containing protein [Candidatus Termiticorpusculum sp.]
MPKYLAGEIIKQLREQRGMTQQELSASLLERGHLSKIENGKIMPKKDTLKVLLERLGYNPILSMDFFLGEKEAEFQSMVDKIEGLLKMRKTQEADVFITQLENNEEFMKIPPNKQQLLYFKAGSKLYKNEDAAEVLKLLEGAIKITTPKFREEYIPKYFLTKTDIAIINGFAIVYGENNQLENAIALLYRLKDNFDNRFMDNESKGRHYPMVIENLTRYLTKAKKHEEAIKLCDVGIKFCIESSHMRLLPRIVTNKAICMYEIGDKEQCKKLLRQAYYTYEMREQFDSMQNIKNYVQERPDIAFL